MKIYWTLKSIPELKNLEPMDRIRVWRIGFRKAHKHWETKIAFVFFLVMLGGGGWLVEKIARSNDITSFIWRWLAVLPSALVGGITYINVATKFARQYMRTSTTKEEGAKN